MKTFQNIVLWILSVLVAALIVEVVHMRLDMKRLSNLVNNIILLRTSSQGTYQGNFQRSDRGITL